MVELLKTQGLNCVKLYNTDTTVLTTFANLGMKVVVAIPKKLLATTTEQSFTDTWVQANIFSYYLAMTIETIAIRNKVFVDPNNTTKFLVPAMKSVHPSLVKYNLDKNIKISSLITLFVLQNSFPASFGSFKTKLLESVIKPFNYVFDHSSPIKFIVLAKPPFPVSTVVIARSDSTLQHAQLLDHCMHTTTMFLSIFSFTRTNNNSHHNRLVADLVTTFADLVRQS